MAIASQENAKLFIEHNNECEVEGLIEWIIELLPQQDFDNYLDDIKNCEEE